MHFGVMEATNSMLGNFNYYQEYSELLECDFTSRRILELCAKTAGKLACPMKIMSCFLDDIARG